MDMLLPSGQNIKMGFDKLTSAEAINDRMFAVRVIAAADSLTLAEPFFGKDATPHESGEISLHYDDINKAKRVSEIFLGDQIGYSGKLPTDNEIRLLQKRLSACRIQGIATIGSHDSQTATDELKGLRILSEEGLLDWSRLESFAYETIQMF